MFKRASTQIQLSSSLVLSLCIGMALLQGCSSHQSKPYDKRNAKDAPSAGAPLTKMPIMNVDLNVPKGYTRLFEVDHSILVYPQLSELNPIILPTRVALALKAVNKEAKEQGFNLVVYQSKENELDATLIVLGKIPHPKIKTEAKLYNHESIIYYDDGTFNMGTSYLDESVASHHGSPLVSPQAGVMRNYLRALMGKHGFKADTLWWRYSFS